MKKLGRILLPIGWILFPVVFIVAFAVPSDYIPYILLPLIIVMIVCIILGFQLSFYGKASKKVRNGPLVVGKIISAEKTGGSSGRGSNEEDNVKLTVEFFTQDGRKITASDTKMIPFMALPQFQPGKGLPIRYDPQNPQDIMFETKADPELVKHAEMQYYLASGQTTQEKVNILEKGVHAKGVILSSIPTGNIVNDLGELQLQVQVIRPDASTFEVTTTKAVSHDNLSFTTPGSVVHVYYLPMNEQNIVISFHD